MKINIQNEKYDTMLEASDWRYSAAIIGILKYLDFHDFDYEIEDDYILYNSYDIDEKKYLEYVEYKYSQELHHKIIENILSNQEITLDQVNLVNEKLSENSIMKNTFNKIKFDNTNKKEILNIIDENRYELIRETFGKKDGGYKTYVKINMRDSVKLLEEEKNYCRLNGYSCAD